MNVVNITGTVKFFKLLSFGQKDMVSFVLCNKDKYINKEGKEVEVSSFIDCEAWGALSKAFSNISEGDFIEVFGNLKTFIYESKKEEGVKRKKTSINIKSFNLKRKATQQEPIVSTYHPSTDSHPYDPDDDELPF